MPNFDHGVKIGVRWPILTPQGVNLGSNLGPGGGQNDPPRGPNWTLEAKTVPHGQNDPQGVKIDPPRGQNDLQNDQFLTSHSQKWSFWRWVLNTILATNL